MPLYEAIFNMYSTCKFPVHCHEGSIHWKVNGINSESLRHKFPSFPLLHFVYRADKHYTTYYIPLKAPIIIQIRKRERISSHTATS